MKYTPSALVSEFSGAQGSTVASHNRFGPYFRNRTIPVNPNTLVQQNARNNLIAASRNWKALTEAQRQGFEAAAALIVLYDALGRPYSPTGQQYYVSVARSIYVYDPTSGLPTTPPIITPVAILTTTTTATSV